MINSPSMQTYELACSLIKKYMQAYEERDPAHPNAIVEKISLLITSNFRYIVGPKPGYKTYESGYDCQEKQFIITSYRGIELFKEDYFDELQRESIEFDPHVFFESGSKLAPLQCHKHALLLQKGLQETSRVDGSRLAVKLKIVFSFENGVLKISKIRKDYIHPASVNTSLVEYQLID